jgi:hypothetical protein
MRRSRYGGYGYRKPRTKKIRPAVRVRERIAKKGGRCAGCRARFEKGDPITVVIVKQKKFHTNGCVPANINQPGSVVGAAPAGPMSAANVATALSASWSFGEAKMVGLLALENALVAGIRSGVVNVTDEIDKQFDKYNKVKAVAMRPGSVQEEKQAMVLAATALVKMVFNQ